MTGTNYELPPEIERLRSTIDERMERYEEARRPISSSILLAKRQEIISGYMAAVAVDTRLQELGILPPLEN